LLFGLLCLGLANAANGASYYIDANDGDDSSMGTLRAGPWKSLARVAPLVLQPGDNVLLHCASVWHEGLALRAKGTAQSPVLVAPYGDCPGTRPTIRLTRKLASGVGAGDRTIPLGFVPKMVVVANQVVPRARFPDQGFLTLLSEGNTWRLPLAEIPVTRAELGGADLVVRVNDYTIEERRLYGVAANGEYALAKPFGMPLSPGAGAFLEGLPWMISKPNQWAYDAALQQLHVRLHGTSADIETALPGSAIVINGSEHLTVRGLTVNFVEMYGVEVNASRNVRLEAMSIRDVGIAFVNGKNSDGLFIDGLLAERSQHDGIVVRSNGATVTNSDLSEVGTSVNLRKSVAAIEVGYSADAIITHNRIRNTGYAAIMFGKRARIENNSILQACTRLADCGAIYTSGATKKFGLYGAAVRGNLISGVPGNIDGTGSKYSLTAGIYLDDESAGIVVENNYIEFAQRGIFSKAHSSRISGNTIFASERAIFLTNAGSRGDGRTDGNQLGSNRIVATNQQPPVLIVGLATDPPLVAGDQERYWIPDGMLPAETWIGGQRSNSSAKVTGASARVSPQFAIKRITKAKSIVNMQSLATTFECPMSAGDCAKARTLTDQTVPWPILMPPFSAHVFVIPQSH